MQWTYDILTGRIEMVPQTAAELDITAALFKVAKHGGTIETSPIGHVGQTSVIGAGVMGHCKLKEDNNAG